MSECALYPHRAQTDLLIDRRDHVIDLCEVKFSEKEYVIDKDYSLSLRSKRDIFRAQTGTGKTLQTVMITTFGVRQNKYSGILSEQVTLDDLFACPPTAKVQLWRPGSWILR